jgi:hypothetical protein
MAADIGAAAGGDPVSGRWLARTRRKAAAAQPKAVPTKGVSEVMELSGDGWRSPVGYQRGEGNGLDEKLKQ